MLAYIKLKTNDKELYETNYLQTIQQNKNILLKIQYLICKLYFYLIVKLKYYLNIITVKKINNAYIFILPFSEIKKSGKFEKNLVKVNALIKKYNIKTIVVEDTIKENIIFKKIIENKTNTKQVYILEGRGIMPYLVKETLQYIIQKQGSKTELEDLYICVKEYKNVYVENIKKLIKHFKTVNIITTQIKQFQNLANQIENNENIIITVANNKKKSLKKAKYILNFDLPTNEINKYTIYREATILTINDKCFYESNTFNGIQIRKIEIDVSNNIKQEFMKYNLLKNNNITTLYESVINPNLEFDQIRKMIKRDNVKITALYGKNGPV